MKGNLAMEADQCRSLLILIRYAGASRNGSPPIRPKIRGGIEKGIEKRRALEQRHIVARLRVNGQSLN